LYMLERMDLQVVLKVVVQGKFLHYHLLVELLNRNISLSLLNQAHHISLAVKPTYNGLIETTKYSLNLSIPACRSIYIIYILG
jgi:hypothetical protein